MTGTLTASQNDQQQLEASLRLALVEGVGPLLDKALLNRFGSAQAVLRATSRELQCVPGIGFKIAKCAACGTRGRHRGAARTLPRTGLTILTETSREYPLLLGEIPDPPGVLFLRGTLLPADALAVAIVGTRHATSYGIQQTERLAAGLARAGVTVVSGLGGALMQPLIEPCSRPAANSGRLGRRPVADLSARDGSLAAAIAQQEPCWGKSSPGPAEEWPVSPTESDYQWLERGCPGDRGRGPLGALITARHASSKAAKSSPCPDKLTAAFLAVAIVCSATGPKTGRARRGHPGGVGSADGTRTRQRRTHDSPAQGAVTQSAGTGRSGRHRRPLDRHRRPGRGLWTPRAASPFHLERLGNPRPDPPPSGTSRAGLTGRQGGAAEEGWPLGPPWPVRVRQIPLASPASPIPHRISHVA